MRKSGEVVVKNLFFCFLILFSIEARAYTFELFSPYSTGNIIAKQLSGKKFILDEYLSFTDSGIESSSTDSGSYDRFIANQLVLSGNYQVSAKLGFNLNILDYITYTKFEGSGAAKTLGSGVENELKIEAGGYIDIGSQLFLGAGLKYYLWNPYTYQLKTSTATVNDSYKSLSDEGYYFYLVKNGSNAQGGIYYNSGNQLSRKKTRSSEALLQDMDLTSEQYIPPTLNFFINFKHKSNNFYIEVTNQLYTMLDETKEDDDKFPLENRARIIFAMSFTDITAGLSYLDANYATQEKINADTIARYMIFSKYRDRKSVV